MKYIRSRSEFLNHKKHNLILEGGLENDINWGDSLAGRLFSSIFRVAKMGVDTKRMDGLGNSLRKVFNESLDSSIKDPNNVKKIKQTKLRLEILGYVEGLIEVLKKAKVKDIKEYIKSIPEEYTQEVIEMISGGWDFENNKSNYKRDEEIVDVLLSIESWKPTSDPSDVEKVSEPSPDIDPDLKNDIIKNLKLLKSILLSQKKSDKNDFKKGDKIIHDGEEGFYISGDNEYDHGRDGKMLTNDDEKQTEIEPDESFITKDGVNGEVVKTKDLEKNESLLFESSINNELISKSIKNIFLGEDIKSGIKEGTELNVNPNSIDWLIKNSNISNSLLNIYKIIHIYVNKKSSLSISEMYERVTKEYLKNRSNKNPGQGTRARIWRECVVAKKISDLYKSINKSDDLEKLGELIEQFKNSMKDILSKINKMSNEPEFLINEATLSDFEEVNPDIKIKVENEDIKSITNNNEEFRYKVWFNSKLLPIQKSLKFNLTDIEEINVELNKAKYVIDVIEIVKIFRKAAKLYIKNRIPSNRSGGKITTARANNWETVDGGSVDPNRPSGGPFRNIKLYEKWTNIVLDVIREFDSVLKKDNSLVKLSNNETVKPTKSIYEFMNDALEGDKLSGLGKSGSNQYTFLKGYFGDKISKKIDDLGEIKLSGDKKPDKKAVKDNWIEIKEIDNNEGNVYKIELDDYIYDNIRGESITDFYLYTRQNKDGKVIYLFENDSFIKENKGPKDFPYENKGDDYVYMTISKLPIKKDSIDDFDVLNIKSKKMDTKKFNVGSSKIKSIKRYKDKITLKDIRKIEKSDLDKIKNPFKNI